MNGGEDTKGPAVLARFVQVVGFVFAAFGGFLAKMAPPDEAAPGFAVGIASFLSLSVLLYVAAISKGLPRRKHKRRWLIASGVGLACALVLGMLYHAAFLRYTFAYPTETSPDRYIAGAQMTPAAQAYAAAHPDRSASRAAIVLDFQGLDHRSMVWTTESLARARELLLMAYLGLVLSFAMTIFCLTEGVLQPTSRRGDHTATPGQGK